METEPSSAGARTIGVGWIFAGSFLVLLFAVSGESLWIDEANTAWKVMQPDLKSWWREMAAESGSDLQMPLYMIYVWAFSKIFGATEFALRAANLPWLLLGIGSLLRAFPMQKKIRIGIAIATALSPFVWFYLNEARPYGMQLGASLLFFAALVSLFSVQSLSRQLQWLWSVALAIGIIFLCGSSMLGVIFAGAALLAAAVIAGKKQTIYLLRTFPALWIATLLVLLALGIYFLWTLKMGARASGAAVTDIKSVLFVFYELLGFAGLGPGRLEIREAGIDSFRHYAPRLIIYGISMGIILMAAWRCRDQFSMRRTLYWSIVWLGGGAVFLFLVGYITHFRVLARHFTPVAGGILFLIGAGLSVCWSRDGWKGRLLAVLFVTLSIFSCLSLRFAPRHRKDDYRSAALIANANLVQGKTVLWNADYAAARYYHLVISEGMPSQKEAQLLRNPEKNHLPPIAPDVVITSKPDIYDVHGILREFLSAQHYKVQTNLPAFTIWEKSLECR